METPKRNEYIEKVAAEVIEKLDLTFDRPEVIEITKWVAYLATQEENSLCSTCGGCGYTQEKCAGGSKIDHPCPVCASRKDDKKLIGD